MTKLLVLLLAPLSLLGQNFPERTLDTGIDQVTVFLQGAQVTRSGELQLPAGETLVVARALTPYLDDQSIQVKAEGSFTLMAINHRINYLQDLTERDEKIDSLKKALATVEDLLMMERSKLQILDEKTSLLRANHKLAGNNSSVTVTQLQQAMRYLESEMTGMAEARLISMNEEKRLLQEKARIEYQLREWDSKSSTPSGEIVIRVRAEQATPASFTLSYVTRNAGWVPQYDIRVDDINSPVELSYKAEVFQNTGIDWQNVNLSFSNGNPNQSGDAPQLSTWYLSFYEPYLEQYRRSLKATGAVQRAAAPAEYETEDFGGFMEEPDLELAETVVADVVEGATTVRFAVPVPYTVTSNGERFTVDLVQHEVEAIYEYYAVPKLDTDAFLIARVVDWGQLNLLSGQATLYFEDAYVGRSLLNAANVTDTLNLSLGRDRSSVISRERVEQYSRKKTIGNAQTESRGWKLTARNNKSQPINLVISDQVPVSTSGEIEVEVVLLGMAHTIRRQERSNGRFSLKPGRHRNGTSV